MRRYRRFGRGITDDCLVEMIGSSVDPWAYFADLDGVTVELAEGSVVAELLQAWDDDLDLFDVLDGESFALLSQLRWRIIFSQGLPSGSPRPAKSPVDLTLSLEYVLSAEKYPGGRCRSIWLSNGNAAGPRGRCHAG